MVGPPPTWWTMTTNTVPHLRVPNYISLDAVVRRYPVQAGPRPPRAEIVPPQPQRLAQFVLDTPAEVFAARRLRNNDFGGPKTQPAFIVEQQRLMASLPDFWERSFALTK